VLPLAASRINWAISSGWDTGDAWLELAISIVVKNSKSTKLILSSCFLDMYLRKGLQCLFKDDAEII
jgi:hypothetical protein